MPTVTATELKSTYPDLYDRHKAEIIRISEKGRGTFRFKDAGITYDTLITSDDDPNATDAKFLTGSGSPEGVVTADQKTYYFDTTNLILYIKTSTSDNTGWDGFPARASTTKNHATIAAATADTSIVPGQTVVNIWKDNSSNVIDRSFDAVAYNTNTPDGINYINSDAVNGFQLQLRVPYLFPYSLIAERIEGNATDDSGTPDAIIRVSRTHTPDNSAHSFRDQTTFNPSGASNAIASYDAAMTSSGSAQNIDHMVDYQSRTKHEGSGTVTNFESSVNIQRIKGLVTNQYSYWDLINCEATGTVANNMQSFVSEITVEGTIASHVAFRAKDVTSVAGTVSNVNAGFYCDALSEGSSIYPIYIDTQSNESVIKAPFNVQDLLSSGGSARLVMGAPTTSSYPGIAYNYDFIDDEYIGASDAGGWFWSATFHTFKHAVSGSAGATPTFLDILKIDVSNTGTRADVLPGADNTQLFGNGSLRWAEIYAANGTINTSDERLKTFAEIDDAEKQAALEIKASIKKYKWNKSIEEKGDKARWHFGVGAQTVIKIMKKYGLDAFDYGFICHDQWPNQYENGELKRVAGDIFSVRYEELQNFLLFSL